jgi:acetoacetyl-CoA synthetase
MTSKKMAGTGFSSGSRFSQPLREGTTISRFARVVERRCGIDVGDYGLLHDWSVREPEQFWSEVWDFFGVVSSAPFQQVLDSRTMPGARWFEGATLNYVDQILRFRTLPGAAVISISENGERDELSWSRLIDLVAAFAATLRANGVRAGDRVVGYLPNAQEAVVAFLGTAAVGAVWASCGPDYGVSAAAERLAQLEPTVLVAAAGYRFGGRAHDRRGIVRELVDRVGVRLVVSVPFEGTDVEILSTERRLHIRWAEIEARVEGGIESGLRTEQVPASHPLWVLFSSGTTGTPKGIVHSHAGVVVSHLAQHGLQTELDQGDTLFWYTTTNWMLWNVVVGALLSGVSIVTYDGSPTTPTADRLWQISADEAVTVFGTSAGHLTASADAGLIPGIEHDLSALSLIGVTGAPVAPALYDWVASAVSPNVPLVSSSGGTDVVGPFVGGADPLPVARGRIPGPILGVAVDTFDDDGVPVRGVVGELVVTLPLPSMPTRFWNDPTGQKYRDSYFGTFAGVWRHGDWATQFDDGSFEIHGRSDSTLNRNGVRIGTADLYNIVETHPAVSEALVVGVERRDGHYRMPMFLVPAPGREVDETVIDELRWRLRTEGSPRHVPDEFLVVPAIPHTKTGKKLEVPIKRILQGAAQSAVLSAGAVDRPELIPYYENIAQRWASDEHRLAHSKESTQ